MSRFDDKDFRLGDYWLSKQSRSPAWCRTWYDAEKRQTKRASLATTDFEEAKAKLTEWFILNHREPQKGNEEPELASVLLRYWEDQGSKAKSAPTIRAHLRYWNEFFPKKTVTEASEYQNLETFRRHLHDKGLSATSVNHVLAAGKAAFRLAWRQGALKHVPPIQMEAVGPQEPMGRPLSGLECARLIEAASTHSTAHVSLFALMAIGTAARPSALFELRRSQVDFNHGLIHLNPSGRAQNRKHRPTVKLPKQLHRLLSDWADRPPETPIIQFKGAPIQGLRTAWRNVRTACGFDERVTLYSFRHTMARYMRAEGVPAWEVAAQLGHKIAGTTDRYAPFSPDYLRNAVVAIDGFLANVACELRVSDLSETKAKALFLWRSHEDSNPEPAD